MQDIAGVALVRPPETSITLNNEDEDDEPEECSLMDVNKEMFGKSGARQSRAAYDSDDEDEGQGGQRVQCAQQ